MKRVFVLVVLFLFVGCTYTPEEKCVAKCLDMKNKLDYTMGPCLENEIAPDWVCDIAHSPRKAIDNFPSNQCSAFRDEKAHHFVEVDPDCNVIRVY